MTTKVFVGNLAFPTTDQALAEAFQDCGTVKSGVVITRGRRSLGYGFVEFESPDAALQAVNSKNNSDFKGRTIKVELASDNPVRTERPPRPPPQERNNNRDRERDRDRDRDSAPQNKSNNNNGGDAGAAPRRRRNRRKVRPSSGTDQGQRGSSTAELKGSGSDNPRPRRMRRRTNNNNNVPNKEDRVLSNTAVFVANLPFAVDDESLKAFFFRQQSSSSPCCSDP